MKRGDGEQLVLSDVIGFTEMKESFKKLLMTSLQRYRQPIASRVTYNTVSDARIRHLALHN